jgi:pimeloyl-ACP methyl ester carboxylesterase
MPTIQVNDLNIYYEIRGSGPTLVLLPGLLGTIESDWQRFIAEIARYYRTIAIDLRGHGHTDNPVAPGEKEPGELNILQMADDLIGFLDQLNIEKTAILGYSLGGCVGLLAGLKYPGRIRALVMHATKFFWDETSITAMIADLNPDVIFEKIPRYAQALQKRHEYIYGPDYWKQLLEFAARFVKTMSEDAPRIGQAAKADFPVLVSVGDSDLLVKLEEAIKLVRAIPKSELLVIPATRHPFQFVREISFLPIVLDFLGRNYKLSAVE